MTTLNPSNHAWMRSDAVSKLFETFPEGSLRFVGGCVRNALMGYVVADIDLSTTLEPDAVEALLQTSDIKSVPTGKAHGTITAVINKIPFEITSLRKDVETDGRRAVVSFTKDWAEDAQRRDFTMNALYADFDGQIFDPTGQGVADLEAKKLRFIGVADDRIEEDYLRILRYFRFVASYVGDAKLDKAALDACRRGRAGLKKLSAERVWKELKTLLSTRSPERAMRVMLTHDVLETLLPEATNVDGLERLALLERREAIKPDPILRLMSICAREPLQVLLLSARLKMSKDETNRLKNWVEDGTALDPFAHERDMRKAIYLAGKQVVIDRARLRAAGEEDPIKSSRWMSLVDLAMGWTPPEFPLSGKDLQDAGVKNGPEMGRKLEALKALWVRSGFTADKPKLLMALTLLNR